MPKKTISEKLIRKVELKLDGKTWPLVVTHNVLIECEDLTGLNLIAGEVNLLRPSAKLVRALLYIALRRAGAKYPGRLLGSERWDQRNRPVREVLPVRLPLWSPPRKA